MGNHSLIEAGDRFKPTIGSKEERQLQIKIIERAKQAFIQAAIDLTDALSCDFDAEDDDPDGEHDGAEQEDGLLCAHYQIDQTKPTSLSPWSMPVHEDTIL